MRSLRDNGMYIGNNFPNDPSGVATLSAINRGFEYDENKYVSMPRIIEVIDCTSTTSGTDPSPIVAYPPSIQTGDLVLLVRGYTRTGSAYPPPTLFTYLTFTASTTTNTKVQIDYRVIDGTEGPTFVNDCSSLTDRFINSTVSLMIVLRYADVTKFRDYSTTFIYLTGGLLILANQVTPNLFAGLSLHFYVESPYIFKNYYDQGFMDANEIIHHGIFSSKASGDKVDDLGSSLRFLSRECKSNEAVIRLDIPDAPENIEKMFGVLTILIGGSG